PHRVPSAPPRGWRCTRRRATTPPPPPGSRAGAQGRAARSGWAARSMAALRRGGGRWRARGDSSAGVRGGPGGPVRGPRRRSAVAAAAFALPLEPGRREDRWIGQRAALAEAERRAVALGVAVGELAHAGVGVDED